MGIDYRVGRGTGVLVVAGDLDGDAAVIIERLCNRARAEGPRRLQLDLRQVTDFTPDGVDAITGCLALRGYLHDGVVITVASDAGRRAMLESMEHV
jgi:hypothetical protein